MSGKMIWIIFSIVLLMSVVGMEATVNVIATNVGTTLFTPADQSKQCWTENELALLEMRMKMQDLIPKHGTVNFNDSRVVLALLEYFHTCFHIIQHSTSGKSQHLTLLAFTDVLGGYIRSYVLPLSRTAFYAGKVKYADVKELTTLYEDLKTFLKTNGDGWLKSQRNSNVFISVDTLQISSTGGLEACQALILADDKKENVHKFDVQPTFRPLASGTNRPNALAMKSGNGHAAHQELKISKSDVKEEETKVGNPVLTPLSKASVSESDAPSESDAKEEKRLRRSEDDTFTSSGSAEDSEEVVIPLPLLDDCKQPNSIAVPFRNMPLLSLKSQKSVNILVRYYSTCVKCIAHRSHSKAALKKFHNQLHAWIVEKVYPHLSSEEWYPAFGGVLNIVETMKRQGGGGEVRRQTDEGGRYLFSKGVHVSEEEGRPSAIGHQTDEEENEDIKTELVGAIILMLCWVLACWLWFCRCCSRGNDSNKSSVALTFDFIITFFQKIIPGKTKRNGDGKQKEPKAEPNKPAAAKEPKNTQPTVSKPPSQRSVKQSPRLLYTAEVPMKHHEVFLGGTPRASSSNKGRTSKGSGTASVTATSTRRTNSSDSDGQRQGRSSVAYYTSTTSSGQSFNYTTACHNTMTHVPCRHFQDSDIDKTSSDSSTNN